MIHKKSSCHTFTIHDVNNGDKFVTLFSAQNGKEALRKTVYHDYDHKYKQWRIWKDATGTWMAESDKGDQFKAVRDASS